MAQAITLRSLKKLNATFGLLYILAAGAVLAFSKPVFATLTISYAAVENFSETSPSLTTYLEPISK